MGWIPPLRNYCPASVVIHGSLLLPSGSLACLLFILRISTSALNLVSNATFSQTQKSARALVPSLSMLLRNLGRLALAVATALVPFADAKDDDSKPTNQSTFISHNGHLGFALAAPDQGNDIYFSLRVPVGVSWGAVGLGSDDMKGALFLIIYMNERGDNVTFSPRLAYGNYEPKHYPDLKLKVLEGTGIYQDHMVFNALCTEHCRSWPSGDAKGGWIDVNSADQNVIYAVGPKEAFASNSREAHLKYHEEYGVFSMDMKRTKDSGETLLNEKSESIGTTPKYKKSGKSDWRVTLHGVMMILCIVGLMPAGVVLLRFGGWVRWHALNQTVAMLGVFGGFSLGIVSSFHYQRSRGFDSTHQVLGIMVTAFVLGQFGLGFLHHSKFKKTQQPTNYGRMHRWLGRAILFLGTLNAFIGFTFALNRRYGMILAGILIAVCFISLVLLFGRRFLDRRRRPRVSGPLAGPPQAYGQEPWRQPPPQTSGYAAGPPPGYEAPSNQSSIGLRSMSPLRGNERKNDSDLNLGNEQRPREFS